jgi:hypothetical protein
MFPRKLTRSIAIGTAAIAVAIGAYTSVNSSSSTARQAPRTRRRWCNRAGTSDSSVRSRRTGVPGREGSSPERRRTRPRPPRSPSTPGGTVNRVLKLSDGSYAVHMIKISRPHHVFVSKNFKVTGAIG